MVPNSHEDPLQPQSDSAVEPAGASAAQRGDDLAVRPVHALHAGAEDGRLERDPGQEPLDRQRQVGDGQPDQAEDQHEAEGHGGTDGEGPQDPRLGVVAGGVLGAEEVGQVGRQHGEPARVDGGHHPRGEGEGERNKVFADAFQRDPEFFAFYRSMQAYAKSLTGQGTTLVLKPDSDFFKYFGARPETAPTPQQ